MSERIMSPCPSCGHTTLIVGSGGYLVCGYLASVRSRGCEDPTAADTLLHEGAARSRALAQARALVAEDDRRRAAKRAA